MSDEQWAAILAEMKRIQAEVRERPRLYCTCPHCLPQESK